ERQLLVRDRHSRVGRGVERDVDRGLGQLVHRDDARTGDVGTTDVRVVLAGAAQRAGTGRGARGHADGDRVTGGAAERTARVPPHQGREHDLALQHAEGEVSNLLRLEE